MELSLQLRYLLRRQAGEGFRVRGCAAQEEGSADNIVQITVFIPQAPVRRQAEQQSFLITDQGDLSIGEWVNSLDLSADNFLHFPQAPVNLPGDRHLSWLNH